MEFRDQKPVTAKLSRGPGAGEIIELPYAHELIQYCAPAKLKASYWDVNNPLTDGPSVRYGEYRRSNRVLKNGTIIFEWMGYRDGKV